MNSAANSVIKYTCSDLLSFRYLIAGFEQDGQLVITDLTLGSDDNSMIEQLRKRHVDCAIELDTFSLKKHSQSLSMYFTRANTPIDILPKFVLTGTDFELKVWRRLIHIPFGETDSYSEIARSLGMPNGARAVAKACASNKIALLVPCHRVIRQNGDISGYRWGQDIKEELLEVERTLAANAA